MTKKEFLDAFGIDEDEVKVEETKEFEKKIKQTQ